jgi:hypothetical protein
MVRKWSTVPISLSYTTPAHVPCEHLGGGRRDVRVTGRLVVRHQKELERLQRQAHARVRRLRQHTGET